METGASSGQKDVPPHRGTGHTEAGPRSTRRMFAELTAREQRLIEQIRHPALISRNVHEQHAEQLSLGERVSDAIAATMGSWRFIIIQSAILAVWVLLNVVAWVAHWDPYPFILLNLMLSFQAAYAAPVIMMSQNRQEAKDRLRAEHDYEINLKAEMEIGELHVKLDSLRMAQWEELLGLQRQQLALLERLLGNDTDALSATTTKNESA